MNKYFVILAATSCLGLTTATWSAAKPVNAATTTTSEQPVNSGFEVGNFTFMLDGQSHQSDIAEVVAGQTYQG